MQVSCACDVNNPDDSWWAKYNKIQMQISISDEHNLTINLKTITDMPCLSFILAHLLLRNLGSSDTIPELTMSLSLVPYLFKVSFNVETELFIVFKLILHFLQITNFCAKLINHFMFKLKFDPNLVVFCFCYKSLYWMVELW